MRRLLLLFLFIGTLAALLFLAPLRDGRPLLSPADLRQMGVPMPDRTIRFYRWMDADGVPQHTAEPPPPGTPYDIIDVDPDANLMPGGANR